jgi:hypothetical protein
MGKYILHYQGLQNRDEGKDIKEYIFTTALKRESFIVDTILTSLIEGVVFCFVIDYGDGTLETYISHNFIGLNKVVSKCNWKNLHLFEFDSYEEAYEYALTTKETFKNCYK